MQGKRAPHTCKAQHVCSTIISVWPHGTCDTKESPCGVLSQHISSPISFTVLLPVFSMSRRDDNVYRIVSFCTMCVWCVQCECVRTALALIVWLYMQQNSQATMPAQRCWFRTLCSGACVASVHTCTQFVVEREHVHCANQPPRGRSLARLFLLTRLVALSCGAQRAQLLLLRSSKYLHVRARQQTQQTRTLSTTDTHAQMRRRVRR